jgi:O-antigen/teichoic acid export membrane protein
MTAVAAMQPLLIPELRPPAPRQLDLSVVLVTRGPSLGLARLLRSLGRAHGSDRAELIMGVDDASPQALEQVEAAVERWLPGPSTVVALPNAFPGHNRNALVPRARAEVVVFLDDDVVVPGGFLDGVRDALADGSVGVAGGPNLTPPHSSTVERLSGAVLASPVGTGPVRHRYASWRPGRASELSLTLCNLAVRRDLLTPSPFDAHLRCAEENELLIRLSRDGVNMRYTPDLAVYHQRRDHLASYARQIWKYGFGRGQLLTRAFYGTQATFTLPVLLLTLLAAGLVLAPYTALAALALYAVVVAVAAVRIGGMRHGPLTAALLLATHGGYTLGLIAGLLHEMRRLQRRVLEANQGRFSRDVALTFLAFGLAVAGGVASSVAIARTLGAGGRGSFELVRTLSALVAITAGLGLGRAAVQLRSRRSLRDGEVFGVVCSSLVTGGAAAILAGIVIEAAGLLSAREPSIWALCSSIPLIAFFVNGQGALIGLGRASWFRRTLGVRDVLFFVLLLGALRVKATLDVAVLAWVAHWVVSAGVMGVLLYRQCGRPRFPWRRWRVLVAAGLSPILLGLVVEAHLRLDIVVLDVFRGPAAVGHYAVAVGVAEAVGYGGIALAVVLYPRALQGTSRAAVRTARSVRTVFASSLLAAAALWLVAPRLVQLLFGSAFSASVPPLRAVLPGMVGLAVFFVVASDLAGRGELRAIALVSVGAVAANLLLNLALDPRFGATGAAVASSVTYCASAFALLVAFAKATGMPLTRCVVPRRRDAAAVAAGFFGRRRDALAAPSKD